MHPVVTILQRLEYAIVVIYPEFRLFNLHIRSTLMFKFMECIVNQILSTAYLLRFSCFLLMGLLMMQANAEEQLKNIEYVQIQPTIVTNYQKKSAKKPGFIQMTAQLSVLNKKSVDKVTKHIPLVRAYIIEYLSFTDESVIKDASQRNKLRVSLAKGIQKLLTEHTGEPLIEELVITHFMWD